ncbi:MAG: acyl-CoA desaturase [Planctomycetaceae bacterium]|nr:acyl-CoA desaturase [Planctomycetaceae bacterium]
METVNTNNQTLSNGNLTVPPPVGLDSEEADASLWQEDRAAPITERERTTASGPNYPVIFWLVLLHVGALAAPFCFSWQGLVIALALYWLTGSVGVCLGYHRLLTHGAFKTYKPVRWVIASIGGLSGEGSAVDWVANHRKHHAHSDHDGDPHSPRDGAWWSHVFWLGWTIHGEELDAHLKRWAPDLAKDRGMRWLATMFLPIQILSGILLVAAGYLAGGMSLAISFLVWGLFVRLVIVLHATWLVNSASHIWGYRSYETTDDSRNNWLVALLTFGEGWHNNHHAYPRMAKQGHRWWELDPTFAVIRLMQWSGLAWDVVDYKQRSGSQSEEQ